MFQLVTSPATLLASTLIPFQFTVEYLHSRSADQDFKLGRLLLQFWCLHALVRGIPNPIVYVFQALPLSNFVELAAWLVISRELLGRFCEMEAGRGGSSGFERPASGAEKSTWVSYLQYMSSQGHRDKYVFGKLTSFALRLVEKWPLNIKVLDTSFQTVIAWIGRLGRSAQPNTEPQSWSWVYQWFSTSTARPAAAGDEEYDLLEDVLRDFKKS
ncbi:LAQU0S14e00716g1_1 [Lachancea quebecensis]|uniref:LAQU0S14e00716g1_1 n=1 Tax=Lachancea quebecensis TaxID=1654605 RepID=A0A0P1KW24_9SACH|nr:LAQU0S14e00716g1_1 [Lachancea quebecensis]